jgi:hypothetical protein
MTQGTIFCGACAEGYQATPVWGLVITARCDTAHDKVIVVNYLPVVRVEDWFRRQGGAIVLEKSLLELKTKFAGLLKKNELSDSLLEVYLPSKIAEDYFPPLNGRPANNKERSQQADSEKASALANEIADVTRALQTNHLHTPYQHSLLANKTSITQAVVTELISHKQSGYYFLPEIGELTEHPSPYGYVVLLREVRTIYRETAQLVIEGLSKSTIDPGKEPTGLSFDIFDFAYPIAEVRSPWIEHLLQIFCTMFGRIGLDDIDKKMATTIAKSVFSIKETA